MKGVSWSYRSAFFFFEVTISSSSTLYAAECRQKLALEAFSVVHELEVFGTLSMSFVAIPCVVGAMVFVEVLALPLLKQII